MTKKIFLSLMAVLGLLLSAHAQEREITGSVKDHAGAGIVGATIVVEGTTRGTTSGADGVFSIEAAPDNVLVVSFMGYQSHTIRVGSQTRIDVVLKEDTQAIDARANAPIEIMPFGKYKGNRIADIPLQYRQWMIRTFEWNARNEKLRKSIIATF